MRFITEMELRAAYKLEPFSAYLPPDGAKITPGARQFLIDRGVSIGTAKKTEEEKPVCAAKREDWRSLQLRSWMQATEAQIFLVGAEILHEGDAAVAEEVMTLAKAFRELQQAEKDGGKLPEFFFSGWTEKELHEYLAVGGKDFSIGEFHVGLENGRTIARLNSLRASLNVVKTALLEFYWDEAAGLCKRQDFEARLQLIGNILCIMMQKCLGGQKWKK